MKVLNLSASDLDNNISKVLKDIGTILMATDTNATPVRYQEAKNLSDSREFHHLPQKQTSTE